MTLPQGWVATTIGECSSAIQYGLTCTSSTQGSGYRYIRITDIQNRHIDWATVPFANIDSKRASACEVVKGDLLFARTGATVGKSYLIDNVPEAAAFASYLIRVRCDLDMLLPEFAAWFFQSPFYWQQIYDGAEGTGQPNFNGTKLSRLKFSLPPLAEQRHIVAKLDSLTARLTRARAELGRVPVLAKRMRAKTLKRVFEGYTSATILNDLTTTVTSGSRGWAKYYADDGAAFIRVGDVRRCNIWLDLDDLQRVKPPPGAEGARTSLIKNDIVVTITADLGRVGVVPANLGRAFVNQHVALVRLIEPNSAAWIAWYLSSNLGQQQMLLKDRGVTKAGLGLGDIRDVAIPMPPELIRAEEVRGIEAAFTRADRLEAEATRARSLLDRLEASILARAFRGELVPQDPADETASALLARIRERRAAAPKPTRGRASQVAA